MNKEELDYGVIDDFLPQKEFEIFQSVIMKPSNISNENTIGWEYQSTVTGNDNPNDWKYFYMMHMIYIHSFVFSPILYEKVTPILIELDIKALIRIKCNMYPNTEKVHEHGEHADYSWKHKTALFSLNTCDGYTKLEDGTKIDSVANRMLLFDGSKLHCSSTCTDQPVRVNINFNYF